MSLIGIKRYHLQWSGLWRVLLLGGTNPRFQNVGHLTYAWTHPWPGWWDRGQASTPTELTWRRGSYSLSPYWAWSLMRLGDTRSAPSESTSCRSRALPGLRTEIPIQFCRKLFRSSRVAGLGPDHSPQPNPGPHVLKRCCRAYSSPRQTQSRWV